MGEGVLRVSNDITSKRPQDTPRKIDRGATLLKKKNISSLNITHHHTEAKKHKKKPAVSANANTNRIKTSYFISQPR